MQYDGSSVGTAGRRYLHSNHQGSIIAHSNAAGAGLNTLRYDSYGIPAATNTGRFGYTGQIYFPELGLYYYKARMYNPYLGRFMQTDPIFYEDQMNMYAYVGNDPVNFDDPTGESKRPSVLDQCNKECQKVFGEVVKTGIANVRAALSSARERSPKAERMAANAKKGAEGEAITKEKLGDKVAGEQVSFKTSDGTRTRADFVTTDKGVTETKTGDAKLSPGQEKLKADIDAGREVTPVGTNAEKAGLTPNEPTKMSCFNVDRPC